MCARDDVIDLETQREVHAVRCLETVFAGSAAEITPVVVSIEDDRAPEPVPHGRCGSRCGLSGSTIENQPVSDVRLGQIGWTYGKVGARSK